MKKRTLFLKIVLFCLIFCLIWAGLERLLTYKFTADAYFSLRYEDFEDEPAGSIDVLYLGTSTILEDISPTVIWEEAGITGFNLGVRRTTPASCYYQFLYALEHQTPKVLVLDLCGIEEDRLPDDETWEFNYRNICSTLPSREIRQEMFADILSRSAYDWSWYFPLLRYHSRWAELSREDIDSSYYTREYYDYQKGCMPLYAMNAQAWPEDYLTDTPGPAAETSLFYYQSIVDLCRERGIRVLVVTPPSFTLTNDHVQNAAAFCEANGIPMLTALDQTALDEIGLNPQTHFYDHGHLNIHGQKIYSKYLAQRLRELFDLPDHRGDPAYDHWNEAAEAYRSALQAKLQDLLG